MSKFANIPEDLRVIILEYVIPGGIDLLKSQANLENNTPGVSYSKPYQNTRITRSISNILYDKHMKSKLRSISILFIELEDMFNTTNEYVISTKKAFIDVFNPTPGPFYNPRDDTHTNKFITSTCYESCAPQIIFTIRAKHTIYIIHNFNFSLDIRDFEYILRCPANVKSYATYEVELRNKITPRDAMLDIYKFCMNYIRGNNGDNMLGVAY